MYRIIGVYIYNHSREVIDECETEEEAIFLLSEYALAFGPSWTVYIEEVK